MLKSAADDFLAGSWADRTDTFVYATAASLRRTELVEEFEREATRLARLGIGFERWDAEELSIVLKDEPYLVADFFGPGWRDAYCPTADSVRGPSADLALQVYRRAIIDAGSRVDLRPLGVDLPPVSLESSPTEVRVTAPERVEAGAGDRSLVFALRRRGRMILLGKPGSGKSTAMRQLAAFNAAHEESPLPIFVPLRRLPAGALDDLGTLLVDIAVQAVGPEYRPALRLEILDRMRQGDLLVLLDGLDETRSRRHLVVQAIDRWRTQVGDALELVVATRDSAYASAATLNLPSMQLEPPRNVNRWLRHLLAVLAADRGVPVGQRQAWVEQRLEWVEDVRARSSFGDAVVFPTLLTVLASRHEPDDLPRGRAHVLARTVQDVTERLEVFQRHEGELKIEGVSVESTPRLVHDGFIAIGTRLLEAPSSNAASVEASVATALRRDWGFLPGPAAAAASQIRSFWDEAGVFVAQGADEIVTAPNRLMVEVAGAIWVARQPDDVRRAWLAERLRDPELREVVNLAAGLSSAFAVELVEEAVDDESDDAVLLASAAVRSGAKLPAETLGTLAQSLRWRLERRSDSYDLAIALARLPLSGSVGGAPLRAFDGFPVDERLVLRAIASSWWQLDANLQQALREVLTANVRRRGWGVDTGYAEAIILAARSIDPLDEGLASQILTAAGRSNVSGAERVRRILVDRGFGKQVLDEQRSMWKGLLNIDRLKADIEASDANWAALLGAIASGRQATLSKVQSRRLDELADFMAAFDLEEVPYGWIWGLKDVEPELRLVVAIASTLGGFDRDVLAAEAQVAMEYGRGEEGHMVLYQDGTPRRLDRWNEVQDRGGAIRSLVDVLKVHPLCASMALDCLSGLNDSVWVADLLLQEVAELPSEQRQFIGRFILEEGASSEEHAVKWVLGDDAVLRDVAASFIGTAYGAEAASIQSLRVVLQHPLLVVRSRGLRPLGEPSTGGAELHALIKDVEASAPSSWLCPSCGTENAASASSCRSCHVVSNDWANWVRHRG